MIDIRPARPDEAGLVLAFIRELAEYERLAPEVIATEAQIARLLFAPTPHAFCDIAEVNGEPVGFAFWYYTISTFEGRRTLYLEDIYVRAEVRGLGVGKALMRRLAQRCRDEELPAMEWQVLDWNTPSLEFYERLGAKPKSEWLIRSLSGEALTKLAAS
jgi:GNAT superfamily N-acetyltransferase